MQTPADDPIACTLGSDALRPRLDRIRGLTDRSLLSHRLDGTVLRLTYRIDALSDLEQIVGLERDCCSFLQYWLEPSGDEVRLTIKAPGGLGSDARWLLDQFLPQAQPTGGRKSCGCARGACG